MVMHYVVLALWLAQATAGVSLAVSWWRGGHTGAPTVITHIAAGTVGLALWVVFLVAGNVLPAWLALAALTVGNSFGDAMLRGRSRDSRATTTFWKAYLGAIVDTFQGRMPPRVTFHAVFAGFVYFTCLGVCIGATVATAG
ncbi:hypothetical protein RCH16_003566 [Cryobacterium sp. MP_M5]|uniref:hypothetical protein n=1 Tax=unclassified Cryobacterium TaxID=2649013 RepID=UPI0018CADB20|nr:MULTISPECIES: hypothetical protein [unclassified Cryobacterium]MBG6058990.1 hypothetical protein [Cryobacterium sp. MP_M3]MEC5178527.1 hypothetical protein [Cryobacterium sp. MP_M5]